MTARDWIEKKFLTEPDGTSFGCLNCCLVFSGFWCFGLPCCYLDKGNTPNEEKCCCFQVPPGKKFGFFNCICFLSGCTCSALPCCFCDDDDRGTYVGVQQSDMCAQVEDPRSENFMPGT